MKAQYKPQHIERARSWLVKAQDTFAQAEVLSKSGKTRLGTYNRHYYTSHHICKALLWLVGNRSQTHKAIKSQFGREWIKRRGFPTTYGKLVSTLERERRSADYGDFVPTLEGDIEKRLRTVRSFLRRAAREIPPISTGRILNLLVAENPDIRDLSFDIYCPKTYLHHTRLTLWSPKKRVTDKWLKTVLQVSVHSLQRLRVKEAKDYVIGLNSRVNQYEEKHLVMLDFDDVSTIPSEQLKNEPGFVFRTDSGFHFIGSRLYAKGAWQKRMKKYSRIASKQHFKFSMQRGYATLRLTASMRKPSIPRYIGKIR